MNYSNLKDRASCLIPSVCADWFTGSARRSGDVAWSRELGSQSSIETIKQEGQRVIQPRRVVLIRNGGFEWSWIKDELRLMCAKCDASLSGDS